MKRRRHDEGEREGWTSGGDLADVEETPRSRSDVPSVPSTIALAKCRPQEFVNHHVPVEEKRNKILHLVC